MLSADRRAELIGIASAFSADIRAARGGRAANNKRRSLHIKLLTLWQESLQNLAEEIFGLPPGQVPALANKYFCVSARLSEVSAPGYVVYKGTPLLPKQEEEEEQEGSDTDSVLQEPLSLQDIIEVGDDPPTEGVGSASSSSRLDSSLERRSRSPPLRAQPDLSDLGVSNRLSSGRPLPPEPPVAPPRPPQGPSHTGPKQKARPRPRTEIATVRLDESSADLGAELARGCTLDVGLVLSLDFNGVINRDFASTVRLFRSLATRRDVYLLICSKCSTESLIGPAVDFIRGALREAQYLIRRVPLFFCSRAVRRGGKAEKLYEALRAADIHNLPLWHADDRRDICLEVDRWDGWHAIEVSFRDRRGLDQIVAGAIGL